MVVLPVEVHVVDAQTGQWCPWCCLPSAVSIRLALAHTVTLLVVGHRQRVECPECEQVLSDVPTV